MDTILFHDRNRNVPASVCRLLSSDQRRQDAEDKGAIRRVQRFRRAIEWKIWRQGMTARWPSDATARGRKTRSRLFFFVHLLTWQSSARMISTRSKVQPKEVSWAAQRCSSPLSTVVSWEFDWRLFNRCCTVDCFQNCLSLQHKHRHTHTKQTGALCVYPSIMCCINFTSTASWLFHEVFGCLGIHFSPPTSQFAAVSKKELII